MPPRNPLPNKPKAEATTKAKAPSQQGSNLALGQTSVGALPLLNSALQWLPTAMILCDSNLNLAIINDKASELLGLGSVSQAHKQLRNLATWPQGLKPLAQVFANAATTGDQLRQEVTLVLPQWPEPRTLGYSLRQQHLPYLGDMWVLLFSDITDILKEKAAGEALKDELYQAKKMAAMGNLTAGVALELNNPLIAIHMSASLCSLSVEKLLHEADHQHLTDSNRLWLAQVNQGLARTLAEMDRVQAATQQASTLVDELLTYSRPGRLELELVEWQSFISGLLTQWQPTLLAQLPPEAIKLPAQKSPLLLEIDKVKVEQVLYQLLRNAVQAESPNRPLQLAFNYHVVRHPSDATQNKLRVTLTDNGVGMTPACLERAFEPFFTTKGSGGTGLGLSQAYVSMERHRGSMGLTSQLNEGTMAWLHLPFETANEADAQAWP